MGSSLLPIKYPWSAPLLLPPTPLLEPLLVLPLLVLGVLRPDAEDPVLGLVDVPGLFSEGSAAFGL
jgi:hypothetical protein